MPIDVRMTVATITQMYFGSIGMKKKPMEVTAQMRAAKDHAGHFAKGHKHRVVDDQADTVTSPWRQYSNRYPATA